MERTTEEVVEFVLGVLQDYVRDSVKTLIDSDDIKMIASIRKCIKNNMMLGKTQAKWLENVLQSHLRERMSEGFHHHENRLILWIDELSIYADAWALLCRPGTYKV